MSATTAMVGPVPRRTAALALLLVILLVVAVIQRVSEPTANRAPIAELPDGVERIVIAAPADGAAGGGTGDGGGGAASTAATTLELRLEDGIWRIGEERYPADPAVVEELLETAGALGRVDIVSARGREDLYGLGEGVSTTVRFFTANREPLAIELGAGTAAGDGAYARINGAPEVVVVAASLRDLVSGDPLTYRERLMVEIPEETVRSVAFESALSDGLTVRRATGEGDRDTGTPGTEARDGQPPSDAAVAADSPVWTSDYPVEIETIHYQNLFAELGALRATDFPEAVEGEPFATVTVERADAPSLRLALHESTTEGLVTVVASGVDWPFDIPLWRARRLLLGREELVPAVD